MPRASPDGKKRKPRFPRSRTLSCARSIWKRPDIRHNSSKPLSVSARSINGSNASNSRKKTADGPRKPPPDDSLPQLQRNPEIILRPDELARVGFDPVQVG